MEKFGASFRTTKDIDIVLTVEILSKEFAEVFWDFIRKGKYQNQQKSSGKRLFYRFKDPEDPSYPFMIEFFSRIPDALNIKGHSHLTPIPINDEISNLSAIILENDYYDFIQEGKIVVNEISILRPEYLIPLKAKAWLDLNARVKEGEHVDSKDIKKHKNDIFRLFQIIDMGSRINLKQPILEHVKEFFVKMNTEESVDLKALGISDVSLETIISSLENVYGI
jgi:hypothetical protein